MRLLQRLQHTGERGDMVGRHDLRERDDEARRQLARPIEEDAEEAIQRPDAAAGQPVGERLDPQPDERGERPLPGSAGDRTGRRLGVAVLVGVIEAEVPVLEVDAQILDRLGRKLRGDPFTHQGGEVEVVHAEDVRQRGRIGRVGVQQPQRLTPGVDDGRRGDPVRRHVEHLHWLAGRRPAGPRVPVGRVCCLDPLQQPVHVGVAEARGPAIRRARDRHGCSGSGANPARATVPSMRPYGRSVTTNTSFGLSRP